MQIFKMKIFFTILISSLLLVPNLFSQDGPLTEGVDITLRNTLQDPGGDEIIYSNLFGLADDTFDEFGTISFTETEFPTALAQEGTPFGDISGLYEIDFTEDNISFTILPEATDPFWQMQFGEFPAGKFDRYYFTFSTPHNIASGVSSNSSVNLRVDSETIIVVEISGGYDFNPGTTFNISLSEKSNEVLLEGIDLVLRNTLQDPGEDEVIYSNLFGLADDAFDEFGTISFTESEFPTALAQEGTPFGDISGLYDIDFTEDNINFILLPEATDPFWQMQFGVFPAGKFDRYYFTFSSPHNIASGLSSNSSVNLRVDSETVIVVEISEGYDFNPGMVFDIELKKALTNEEKAIALNAALVTGDSTALQYVSDEQYIQHNLFIPDGKEGIAGFYTGQSIGITVDLHRSFEIGDFVVTHTTFGGSWGMLGGSGSDQVVFDVWRFEDGLMVEHWDNITNVMDDMDGTTQTDGVATPVVDLDKTETNNELLLEMARTLFIEGDWTKASDYFDIEKYVQHSVGAGPDGSFLATLDGQVGVSLYSSLKYVHTSGNFGLVMSEGPDITEQDPDGTYAYYDLFRIENGLIVEHWDIIQPIPDPSFWANDNGKWGSGTLPTKDLIHRVGELKVSPNPIIDMATFEAQISEAGQYQFQVFDSKGKLVKSESLKLTTGANQFSFCADQIISGIYTYRLTNNSSYFSGKLSIIH